MHKTPWRISTDGKIIGVALLAVAGLCFLGFFYHLGTLGLMDKTEGLFAEIPRQMLVTGDLITPHWNTKTFFDYPVWGYWMVGLSYRIFGISVWAARLPAALAASATVFAVFGSILRLSPNSEPIQARVSRALLASTILALSPGWIGWARASVTDMFLASSITIALLGFLLVDQSDNSPNQRRFGHTLLALFSGIAVLAKGPIGVVLPGLTIMIYLLLKRKLLQQIRATPWLPMVSLFAGIVLPWYAMATKTNGLEFLNKFIGFSNFERFTSVLYSHPGPPWFYLPWIVLLLLPWSIYLPIAISQLKFWRAEVWTPAKSPADTPLFAFIWLVVILAFFSTAATKLPGYILPTIPAGSLLITFVFKPFEGFSVSKRMLRPSICFNCGLFGIVAVAACAQKLLIKPNKDYPNLAHSILTSNSGVILFVTATAATLLLAWLATNPKRLQWAWAPNALGLLALLTTAVPVLAPIIDRERLLPVRQLAAIAGASAHANDSLVVVGFKRYSVLLYSRKPAIFANKPNQVINQIGSNNLRGAVLLLGTERELIRFGIHPTQCNSKDCHIIARKDSHLLLKSPIKTIQAINSAG